MTQLQQTKNAIAQVLSEGEEIVKIMQSDKPRSQKMEEVYKILTKKP